MLKDCCMGLFADLLDSGHNWTNKSEFVTVTGKQEIHSPDHPAPW